MSTFLDTGLGLTVPDEQLSHGRDSANVSGHAIVGKNTLLVYALCKKLTNKLLWWWQNLEVTKNYDLLVS